MSYGVVIDASMAHIEHMLTNGMRIMEATIAAQANATTGDLRGLRGAQENTFSPK